MKAMEKEIQYGPELSSSTSSSEIESIFNEIFKLLKGQVLNSTTFAKFLDGSFRGSPLTEVQFQSMEKQVRFVLFSFYLFI